MDQKKEALLHKLEDRNRERLKDSVGGDTVGRSVVDKFLVDFGAKLSSISSQIESLKAADEADKSSQSEAVGQRLKKLQQTLTESSLILAAYEVRKGQSQINELTVALQSLVAGGGIKAESKFAFKSRKKASAPVVAEELKSDPTGSAPEKTPSTTNVTEMAVSLCSRRAEQLTLGADVVKSQDVLLGDLTDCQVSVLGTPSTLHLKGLRNCTVKSLPVATSVFIDNCHDCTFVLACQQLRMHNSVNCRLYLHVTSRGIIEDCSGIAVAPYLLECSGLAESFVAARLDAAKNHWDQLDDFNWLSSATQSPNWSILSSDSREKFSLGD